MSPGFSLLIGVLVFLAALAWGVIAYGTGFALGALLVVAGLIALAGWTFGW